MYLAWGVNNATNLHENIPNECTTRINFLEKAMSYITTVKLMWSWIVLCRKINVQVNEVRDIYVVTADKNLFKKAKYQIEHSLAVPKRFQYHNWFMVSSE